jgi:hypothetical protein
MPTPPSSDASSSASSDDGAPSNGSPNDGSPNDGSPSDGSPNGSPSPNDASAGESPGDAPGASSDGPAVPFDAPESGPADANGEDVAPRRKKHVAVAGNIGAGKSSLTKVLSQYYGWEAFYEQTSDNPYLTDFYNDMRRWSFNLQIFFLSSRFKHQRQIEASDQSVVQDRSIYEDAEIFARNLHEMGLMSTRDYESYTELFALMTSYLEPPSLLVYLRASVPTLVNHIQQRGRTFESTIRIDYLERLQSHYEAWIEDYDRGPKMIIDVDDHDFVNDDGDRRAVLQQIESRLFGLFSDQ